MEQYFGVVLALAFGIVSLAPLLILYHFLPPWRWKKPENVLPPWKWRKPEDIVPPWRWKKTEETEYDRAKESTYECGIDPTGDAHSRFTVKFFLMAVIFVIFDIEAVLIFPWAVTFKLLGVFGFIEMMIFIAVLAIGLAYIWKKGALEW